MGSFTEVALSFDFVESVPHEVLSAFSALAAADQRYDAPPLPTPVVEQSDGWEPEMRLAGREDPFEQQPWRHDWARVVTAAASDKTTPHGVLTWTGRRWNLDCRFSLESEPWTIHEAMSWLSKYIDLGVNEVKYVGLAVWDSAPRPFLFWRDEIRWAIEDLNPTGFWH